MKTVTAIRVGLLTFVLLSACGSDPAAGPPDKNTTAATAAVTVAFESDNTIFANPERGFVGNAGDVSNARVDWLNDEAAAGFSMIRSYVRLNDFIRRDLSAQFLSGLDAGLDQVARAGLKVVLRFTYDRENASDEELGIDADIEQVETHITQLKPLLDKHRDVIAFLEAGFIGAFGEWHSSVSGLDSPANKLRIRNALMNNMPPERFILFRDPADHMRWFNGPITEAEAFGSSIRARAGFHNDCFLSGSTDGNTYPLDQPGLRSLVQQGVRFVPFGGETCRLAEPRNSCAEILSSGAQYAVTYLNWYFYRPAYHAVWEEQGCLDDIRRLLGYRFELVEVSHPGRVAAGSTLDLTITLRNRGWARLYQSRQLIASFVSPDGDTGFRGTVLGIDPRDWVASIPPGTTQTVATGSVAMPANLPPGVYRLALSLPDSSPRLANDPRFSIRFANRNRPESEQVWDAVQARLFTGSVVTVEDTEPARE